MSKLTNLNDRLYFAQRVPTHYPYTFSSASLSSSYCPSCHLFFIFYFLLPECYCRSIFISIVIKNIKIGHYHTTLAHLHYEDCQTQLKKKEKKKKWKTREQFNLRNVIRKPKRIHSDEESTNTDMGERLMVSENCRSQSCVLWNFKEAYLPLGSTCARTLSHLWLVVIRAPV